MIIKSVYLAGSFASRMMLRGLANDWMDEGFVVTSNWLWWEPKEDDQAIIETTIDLLDRGGIELADMVVVFTDVPSTKGGFHVELGLALGMDKQVVVVGQGPLPNGFYTNPAVVRVRNNYEAIMHCFESHLTMKGSKHA